MQYAEIEIKALQVVLIFLGFYRGAVDGIWSGGSITAMQAFECDDKFLPAVPTGGYPFTARSRLPKGMYWDKNIVAHTKLTPERMAEILEKHKGYTPPAPALQKAPEPAPEESAPTETEVKTEEPVVTETEVKAEPVVESQPAVPKQDMPRTGNPHSQQNRNDRQRR